MRDDYQIEGKTVKLEVEIEENVVAKLKKMSDFKKLTPSELVNTAVRRFISQHKDFFPEGEQ